MGGPGKITDNWMMVALYVIGFGVGCNVVAIRANFSVTVPGELVEHILNLRDLSGVAQKSLGCRQQ